MIGGLFYAKLMLIPNAFALWPPLAAFAMMPPSCYTHQLNNSPKPLEFMAKGNRFVSLNGITDNPDKSGD
jgi:hypothetical protein